MKLADLKIEADKPDPEEVLYRLRQSHPDMEGIFLCGGCYSLYLILAAIFPQAKAYYCAGHIYTEIDGVFFDIRGIRTDEEVSALVRLPNSSYNPELKGWGMNQKEWEKRK